MKGSAFRCEQCGSRESKIVDSRTTYSDPRAEVIVHYVRRRRECKCGNRYTTREISEADVERLKVLEEIFLQSTTMLTAWTKAVNKLTD